MNYDKRTNIEPEISVPPEKEYLPPLTAIFLKIS